MKEATFYVVLATLLAHELDAVSNHEWRMLPLLQALPEDSGRAVFVLLHIPLFAVLFALLMSSHNRTPQLARWGVAIFLIFHAGLHALFVDHPNYEFTSRLSTLLIYGGSLVSGLYITLEARAQRDSLLLKP